MTTVDDEAVDVGTEGATGADEDTEATGEEQEGREAEEGEESAGADESKAGDEKLPKDAPEWVGKRIGKLTARFHQAEERRAQAEQERDQYKTEAEKAKERYGDRDILATAKLTGILPELMTTAEAQTLARADTLEKDIERLEEALDVHPEGWESNGRTVTAAEARGWLREARRNLKEIADDAAEIRKSKAAEVRELIKLGREAKAKGKTEGAEAGKRTAAPVKVKPAAGAAPGQPASLRRPVTQQGQRQAVDLSKIKNPQEMLDFLTRKHGG